MKKIIVALFSVFCISGFTHVNAQTPKTPPVIHDDGSLDSPIVHGYDLKANKDRRVALPPSIRDSINRHRTDSIIRSKKNTLKPDSIHHTGSIIYDKNNALKPKTTR
jgi:hypothetical protein